MANPFSSKQLRGLVPVCAAVAVGCGGEGAAPQVEPGFEELVQALDPVNATFYEVASGTHEAGELSISVGGAGYATTAIVGLRSEDKALVLNYKPLAKANGQLVQGTAVKNVVIDGAAGSTVIFDLGGGLFATGVAAGPKVKVGSNIAKLKVRGSSGADVIAFGEKDGKLLGAFNGDAFPDLLIENGSVQVTVSGIGGKDVLSAAGGTRLGNGALAWGAAVAKSPVTFYGGAGDDSLTGSMLADLLDGGDGNDTFPQGAARDGSDTIIGGAGTDTVDFSARTATICVTLGDTNADPLDANQIGDGECTIAKVPTITHAPGGTVYESAEWTSLENDTLDETVENVTGSATKTNILNGADAANSLVGGSQTDYLTGGLGDDLLDGGAGDDLFDAGENSDGKDTFKGGAGTDTVDYGRRFDAVTVTMGDGKANDGESSEGDNVGSDLEVLYGTAFNDTLSGNVLANSLYGLEGDDTISGGAGDDTIFGGEGDDTLKGEAGNDLFDEEAAANGADKFFGGAGFDGVRYEARIEAISVTIAETTTVTPGGSGDDGEAIEGDDVLGDVERVVGGEGDDLLTGNAGDNVLEGMAGDDLLVGQGGDDTLDGGQGQAAGSCDCGEGTGDIMLSCTDVGSFESPAVVTCEL
jgi:Ca2+-binding RTX toxin-like protein